MRSLRSYEERNHVRGITYETKRNTNIQNILYFTDGKATKEELEKYSQKKEEYYRQFCKEDTEKFHLVDGVCEFLII